MLEAGDSSVGRLGGADVLRQMDGYGDVFFVSFIHQGEERLRRERIVDLDEIDAFGF